MVRAGGGRHTFLQQDTPILDNGSFRAATSIVW